MALRAFLVVSLLAISSISAYPQPDQQAFSFEPTQTGLLRRFAVRDAETTDQLVQLAEAHDLDIWQITPAHVDIYSPPSGPALPVSLREFPHTATNISVPSNPYSNRHSSNIEEWDLTTLQNTTFHSSYHPLYEIDRFIHELAELHPDIIQVVELGHSSQGREMRAIRISKPGRPSEEAGRRKQKLRKGKDEDENMKMGFIVSGAQHAREWVATAASLYIAHALVTDSSEPRSLSHLLDIFDFYIIPSPNPDGYDYTWESDRFWYKNRQITSPHAECIGLDMNRNWGYKWKPAALPLANQYPSLADENADVDADTDVDADDVPKEPTDPCSVWYPGRRPFQSPEVNGIANYVATLPNLKAFIDLRSYGQMLSSPFSFSCKRIPKDAEDQLEAALGAAQALRFTHGTTFNTGNLCSTLYRAPGNIIDWMYDRVGIKYTYAAHLRDTGTYGFSLPAEWIRPVGEETASMVNYLGNFIARRR